MNRRSFTADRRRFIVILPLGAATWLAACSKPADPTTPAAAPTPAPAPAPAPAPVPAPAPAVNPADPPPAATVSALTALDEADPLAKSLGYVEDAARADTARFKNHVAGSHCANCAVFQGSAGSARGGCPIFAGKSVAATGWCSAWTKKA